MQAASSSRQTASAVDDYVVLETIGTGSFGKILKVKRKSDGKIFARKELCYERMTEQDRKQIVAEVNILRVLKHKNIVKYEDRFLDTIDGILYIVMEFCEGGDLGALIKRCRRNSSQLPEEMIWSYLAQMVSGLDLCHNRPGSEVVATSSSMSSMVTTVVNRRGSTVTTSSSSSSTLATKSVILHRDLKPENVFLDGEQTIKLGDFGLSKELQAERDFTMTYVGTPYYMSPELAQGERYNTKSDIWALGCIVYELCALKPPFDAKTQDELTRKIKRGLVPKLPSCYSPMLQNVVQWMLRMHPDQRPSTNDLLEHPSIVHQLKTLELLEMQRFVEGEKTRLAQLAQDLDAREGQLQQVEQDLHQRLTAIESNGATGGQEAALASREAALAEREMRAHAHEEQLQGKERELRLLKLGLEREMESKKSLDVSPPDSGDSAPSVSRMTARRSRQDGETGSEPGPGLAKPLRSSGSSAARIRRLSAQPPGTSTGALRATRTARRVSPTLSSVSSSHAQLQLAAASAPLPGTDDWQTEEAGQDSDASPSANFAPVESTPLRPTAASRRIARSMISPSAGRDVDDSDVRMRTFDKSGVVESLLPTAKSFPSLGSGKSLAQLAAYNSAGLTRSALKSRPSAGNVSNSAQDISMKSASGDDKSLPRPLDPKKAASPFSDDSLPSVFINRVSRTSLAPKPSRSGSRHSGDKQRENLDGETQKKFHYTITSSPTQIETSGGIATVTASASALALGAAGPGAPAGRVIGRPRASAATLPIGSSRAPRLSSRAPRSVEA